VDPERTAHMLAEEPAELLRLPALSDDAEALGGALALLELPVSLDYLPPLVNLPEERLRIAREELLDRGLARLEGRQLGCRSLPIAHALASRIPQPERLHRVVVEQLLRQHAPDLVRLGWHLVGARDASRIERHGEEILAAAVLRDGAEAAALAEELWAICPCERLVAPRMHALRAAGRTSDARRLGEGLLGGRAPCPADLPLLVELARIHIGSEGRDDLALRCVERARLAGEGGDLPPELVHAEAWIHHRAGRFEEALAAARPLAEGEPPAGPEELERWMRLRVVWARALHGMGRSEEALALLEPLPESLGQGRRDRALLDITQGGLLLELGRQRDAIDALERAAHTDSGLAAAARAEQWYTAAVLRHELGDLRGALVGLERALPLLERLDEPRMRVRVQSRLCVLYRELARWDRAVEAGSWALHSARELGDERRAALAASRLADVFLAQGSWREAQRWISRAEGLAREHGLSDLLAPLLRRRAELAVQRQDPRATALAEHARAKALEAGDEREQASSSVLLAFCHARAGRAEQLDQVGNPALEILKRVGGGALAEARLWLAEAYLLVGRMENALATGNQALVYADEVGHEQLRRRAHSLVGRVRDIRGGGFADDRLERLLELTVAVAEERVLQRIFEAIAAAALDLLSAEHVHVLVSGEDGEARVVASAVAEGADDQAPPGPVVQRALQEGREVFAADLGERPELWDAREGALPDLRSALCVPLAQGGERFGALYVGSHAMPSSELQQVARLLRALAAFGSVAALNARHMDETARRAEKAAELAHDLRTPASAIHVVVSGLLAAKSDDDPERDVLMRVLEAAQRIRSMAGGILDEGRPGARPVLMSNLVERMVGLLRHVASQRGVRLELAVRPGLWVDGDPQELSRLVTNLVSNALKYAPKGSRIAVGLAQDDRGLVLLVRDQGPGIPKGSEETIFHRGHQAEGAGPGHGLGLYICQRIVKEHGGSISARNHRRGGAVFTVRLPRRVRAWDSLPQHAV
jgi:signal transduction histidine kinase/tetratricopeptide (TPR) repeat protein